MYRFCQGVGGFQTEEELKAEIERDVLELGLMRGDDEYSELQKEIYRG